MTARADHSIRMYRRRPPGIKPVSSRWSHGPVRGLPPKPRRVVKAPARHNRRRGLSTLAQHTRVCVFISRRRPERSSPPPPPPTNTTDGHRHDDNRVHYYKYTYTAATAMYTSAYARTFVFLFDGKTQTKTVSGATICYTFRRPRLTVVVPVPVDAGCAADPSPDFSPQSCTRPCGRRRNVGR